MSIMMKAARAIAACTILVQVSAATVSVKHESTLHLQLSKDRQASRSYRMLEGRPDTDGVYKCAWFHALVFAADYRF